MLRLLASASGAPNRTPSASEGLFASPWHLLGRSLALPVLLGALSLCPCLVLADDPPLPNPDKPVDYAAWINAQYSKGIKENAAEVYREALDAFVEDKQALELATRWDPPWRDYEQRKLQRWVERNEWCLERFAAASRMRDCYFEFQSETGSAFEVGLPMMKPLRDVSKMLAARARLRLAVGETEAAVEDIVTVICAGRHLESQPDLIGYLVAVSVRATAYGLLIRLPYAAPQGVDYDAVFKAIRRVDRAPRSPKKQLGVERITYLDALQRYCRDIDGDGRVDRLDIPNFESVELTRPQSVEGLVAEGDRFLERWYEVLGSDYATGKRLAQELRQDLRACGRAPVCVLLAGFDGSMRVYWWLVAQRGGARIVLRMHAFKAEHGRWPKDLKETGAPSSIRKDPFSGQDFVYRLVDGQPLLYSVSVDGDDDGGRRAKNRAPDADGDWLFWPPEK